jgi:hypothetical protein
MPGEQLAKLLAGAGLLLILAGGIVWLLSRAGVRRLPGDIHLERDGFSFSFPIVTCIVISIVLTLLLNLFRR